MRRPCGPTWSRWVSRVARQPPRLPGGRSFLSDPATQDVVSSSSTWACGWSLRCSHSQPCWSSPGLLSVTAVFSKLVCSLCVLDKSLNRLAVGVSMIPRGEVGLIFAGVGSSAMVSGEPLFSAETFSAMVAMVMVTTLLAPPLIAKAFERGSHSISRPQAAQA